VASIRCLYGDCDVIGQVDVLTWHEGCLFNHHASSVKAGIAVIKGAKPTPNSHGGLPAASGGGGVYGGRPVDVDGGAGATVVDPAVVGVVVVGVQVAVLDDEAAEVTEVGVVLGVPLDEQRDIAMANAVDNIAVTHRRSIANESPFFRPTLLQ
jgi:hypothetical protein